MFEDRFACPTGSVCLLLFLTMHKASVALMVFLYCLPHQVSNDVGGGETVARVSALDKEMKQRAEDARERGKVIRYIIGVDGVDGKEEATAGIREVDTSHPYASLEGAAFCVMYKTKVSVYTS